MSLRFQDSILCWATNKMEGEEMKREKAILGILIITITLILLILSKQGFCDDVGDPYSGESTANIGAWYDETWQADGFYRLERIGVSDNFRYEYTATSTTTSDPTFVKDGSAANKQTDLEEAHRHEYTDVNPGGHPLDKETEPAGEHLHGYTDATSGASLPQDIVVTEWMVSGHVHFTASQ